MRSGVVVTTAYLAVQLTGCHLADDPEPPTCAPGSHPMNGFCAADPLSGPIVTIAPEGGSVGGGCTVSPVSITVALDGVFSFDNEDTVDHVVTGGDGQTWTTVKAGQPSAFVGISKVGTWSYVVSGCTSGGTVIVQ